MTLPFLLGLVLPVLAQTPPQVTPADEAQALRIANMDGADPVGRVNQLLEAKKLGRGAQFALAGTHPGLIEQLIVPEYSQALDYLDTLPAPDLHRVRRGETLVRTVREFSDKEEEVALGICERFELKCKKLEGMRVGPFEGRVVRVEVTAKGKAGTLELAWPSTPERDEKSRDELAKYFGARPSRVSVGVGSLLPLIDGSFEDSGSLGRDWKYEDGVVLGTRSPVADVTLDSSGAVDGVVSLRIYGNSKTRLFPAVVQRITVAPYTRLRARCQLRTEGVKAEFTQKQDDVYLALQFEEISGRVLGAPLVARGRTGTHTWEELEVTGTAPPGTAYVRLALVSGMSGTSWFDGVLLEIAQ